MADTDEIIKKRIKDAPITLTVSQFLDAYILGDSAAAGTGNILGKTLVDYIISKMADVVCKTQAELSAALTSNAQSVILWTGSDATLLDGMSVTLGCEKIIYMHRHLLGTNCTILAPAGCSLTVYGDFYAGAHSEDGWSWKLNSQQNGTSSIRVKWLRNASEGKIICDTGTVLYERLESGLTLETNGTPGSESYINQEFWDNTNANTGIASALSFVDIDSTNSPFVVTEANDEIVVSTATADVVVTLPVTSLKRFYIKWLLGTHNLTVNVANSGMIDGVASFVFNTKFSVGTSISFVCKESGDWIANEINKINESDLVHKSSDETMTGGKAFAKGAIFYGQNLELPTTVGNFIAAYTHPTYGPRVLAHNGTTYAPLKFGPMPTVNKFALDMRANGDVAFGYRLILGNYASAPTGTLEGGMVYFNTSDHLFYGYNGSAWISLGGGGSSEIGYVASGDSLGAVATIALQAGSTSQWSAHAVMCAATGKLTPVVGTSLFGFVVPQTIVGGHFIGAVYKVEDNGTHTKICSTEITKFPAAAQWTHSLISSLVTDKFIAPTERVYLTVMTDCNGVAVAGVNAGSNLNLPPYIAAVKTNMGVLTGAPATIQFESETNLRPFIYLVK